MVQSKNNTDNRYERIVKRDTELHDEREEAYEEKAYKVLLSRGDPAKDVAKFLNESLTTHDSQELLRKANFLSNKKQGRHAGYGFALEGVLRSTLTDSNMSVMSVVANDVDAPRGAVSSPTKLSTKVLEREDLKLRASKEYAKHGKLKELRNLVNSSAEEDGSAADPNR